jgi:hypothetical protein
MCIEPEDLLQSRVFSHETEVETTADDKARTNATG